MIPPDSFSDTLLRIDGEEWMYDGEKDLMHETAQRAYGDVLEVGFGMGFAHKGLHDNPKVQSITIVERDQRVIDRYQECSCPVILKDWKDIVHDSIYDCIFYDIENTFKANKATLLELVSPGGLVLAYDQQPDGTPFFHYFIRR